MTNSKFTPKAKRKISVKQLNFALLIFTLTLVSACQRIEENNTANVSASPTVEEKKISDFEENLAYVRSFNFKFVFAFRRTDGDVFSGDDKSFLKANIPADTNQRVLTADGKCIIIGSNYKFEPVKLDALKDRFSVEDYSPAPVANNGNQADTNANTNAK